MDRSKLEPGYRVFEGVSGMSSLSCREDGHSAMGQKNYADGFSVRCHEDSLCIPASWKKPRMIFVNSMSDLFHDEEIPL